MNEKQLLRGNELKTLIKVTNYAITKLHALKKKADAKPAVASDSYVGVPNKLYHFVVGEWGDGSGQEATLARYEGNDQLLDVIIKTLDSQLEAFVNEFEGL